MGSQPSLISWLLLLAQAAYTVQVVTSTISGPDAVQWGQAEHRRGHDAYLAGSGPGGRYVPPDAILAAASITESIARSDWTTILEHLHASTQIRFPAGTLFSLAVTFGNGQMTLPDLTRHVRATPLNQVPAVCPPGLHDADPALDDLEPWTPGSADELTLAADLGILTDHDHATLITAITS